MAPYRQAYNFTSEPGANKNAADWLTALKTNIYSSMTNHEKVNLFIVNFSVDLLLRNGSTSSQTKVIIDGT